MNEPTDVQLLAYRVVQLEAIEKAIRLEVHDLRVEWQTLLRADYLTGDQVQNKFVTRKELESDAKTRREWFPIIVAAIVGAPALIELIVQLTHR